MRKKVLSIIIGLIIAVVFLINAIEPGPFNLFPYLIHEYV